MNFKEWLVNESSRERVSIPPNREVLIHINPSMQEMNNLWKQSKGKYLKCLLHKGITYVWDAHLANHDEAFNALYLDGEYVGYYFNNEPEHPYDSKTNTPLDLDEMPEEIMRYAYAA